MQHKFPADPRNLDGSPGQGVVVPWELTDVSMTVTFFQGNMPLFFFRDVSSVMCWSSSPVN